MGRHSESLMASDSAFVKVLPKVYDLVLKTV
jgi:hypothetical protein